MKKMFTREYSKYLYQSKDKEVYLLRPSQRQWQDLKQYMYNTLKKNSEGNYEMNEQKSIVLIKAIYDMLSSQKEETKNMTLQEFSDAMNKVIFELKIKQAVTLYRRVEELIKDICEEIKYETVQAIQSVEDYSDTLDLLIDKQNVDSKIEQLTEKVNETIIENNKNNGEIVKETNNKIED